VKCDKCGKEAITYIRYSGAHLCSEHFTDFVERRVKKEIRRQINLKRTKKIAVAVSGGKDSMLSLYLIHRFFSAISGLEIHAITVDEGIASYRPPTLKLVADYCEEMGVEHHIISFKNMVGMNMDDIVREEDPLTPCSYCGVFRRKAMNSAARDIGADVLATGLNLDDTAQSIIMNIARGDIERLARMGPHERVQPGLIPRIQPLRQIPEKESYLYVLINRIPFSDSECPYRQRAVRNTFREIINRLEDETPGARYSILKSYDRMKELLIRKYPPVTLERCRRCGEPANGELCRACMMEESLKKRAEF